MPFSENVDCKKIPKTLLPDRINGIDMCILDVWAQDIYYLLRANVINFFSQIGRD